MLSEYFTFLRNIPSMPDLEKRKLIDLVKVEWNIDSILKSPIDPETNLIHLKNGSDLIDKLSSKIGQSLRIIAPPVKHCLLCKKLLTTNNRPTQIAVHSQTGPKIYSKYILKCQKC